VATATLATVLSNRDYGIGTYRKQG